MNVPPNELTSAYNRDPLSHNQYVLKRQLLKLVGARFNIYDPSGRLAYLADQKGFKLKEEIRVYGDEAMSRPIFGIFARQVLDVSAAYDVVDLATNQKIGVLKRKGMQSLLRDEWTLMDPWDREFGTVVEDSMALAVVRRVLNMVVGNLVPQNYDAIVGGQKAADYRQNFNPFSYHLNIEFLMAPQAFDRRLGLAAAILLAAIEGKQRG